MKNVITFLSTAQSAVGRANARRSQAKPDCGNCLNNFAARSAAARRAGASADLPLMKNVITITATQPIVMVVFILPKPVKIKRYKHSMRRTVTPAGIVLRVFLTVVVVGGLALLGWSAYGPVMDYFSGALESRSGSSDAAPPAPSASSASSEAVPGGAAAPSPTPSPTAAALNMQLRAVYFPHSIISNEALLAQKLEAMDRTDYNAMMFDLKDSGGNVLYQSQRELTQRAASQSEQAVDLSKLCALLKEHEIVPIGRISAFRDPLAPGKIPEAAVKYMGSDILWLDDSPEAGGKPWLNPYSDLAQAYISDIASEAVSLGVSRIVLDGVSFPTSYGQEYAFYGANASSGTRSEVLSRFVDVMDEQIASLGATMYLSIQATDALGANSTYYGSNPLTLSNGRILLNVAPAQLGDGFSLDGFTLDAPVLEPYETVNAILRQLAPDMNGKEITAMIQGYNAPYTVENNKVYTSQDVTSQVRALSDNGVDSYILYNASGDYSAVT